MFDFTDVRLVSSIKCPLLDALGANQTRPLQYLHMFAGGRLADAQLLGDEDTANTVLNEVAINLRRKIAPRIPQPRENLQASRARERRKNRLEIHIDT